MTKPEWGTKRTCLNCGTRFYDMQRTPIVCPKCGSENVPDAVSKARRGMKKTTAHPVAEPKPKAAPVPVEGDEEELDDVDLEVEDDADDEGLIEDTDDLAEDDDMSEMIDHIGPDDED